MITIRQTGLLTAVLAATSSLSAAQVETVATESFEYSYPGLLTNNSGGTGWVDSWDVQPNGNEIVVFENNGSHPPFIDDGIGNFVGQASGYGPALRVVDSTSHSDVTESGKFGADGAVIWVRIRTRTYQVFGDHFGGLSLLDGTDESFFMGSPWGSYAWGIDRLDGNGPVVVAGSDDSVDALLLLRIDYLAGMERARFWINPTADYPSSPPDIDMMVPDHRWERIRLVSGGSGSMQYWDGLRIEKGEPEASGNPIGTNYCGPANFNSSGQSGIIKAFGSDQVGDNDVLLLAKQLPVNQFGYFLNSQTKGFTSSPGGSQGNLCLGGGIGRYNAAVGSTGATGKLELQLDLTQTPTPGGPVAIQPGETWNFQTWFRDKNPVQTSNFTDGIEISFQ